MAPAARDDEDLTTGCCVPLSSITGPVEVGEIGFGHTGTSTFFSWPILGPLLFVNESSDARDHCANERTFLSYLRLSVYMTIVSVAITLSFHLKNQPSELELRMAQPLGAIFWVLSVLTLCLGIGNYISMLGSLFGEPHWLLLTAAGTVNQYSRKVAIVQTGWKTQLVLGIIATAIVGACIIFLVITKVRRKTGSSS